MTDPTPRDEARDSDTSQSDNREQRDDDKQAQTIAEEALAHRHRSDAVGQSRKPAGAPGAVQPSDTPDLVDHMNQMISSGRIDMDAFRGERSDDDEEGELGESGIDSDEPRGAE